MIKLYLSLLLSFILFSCNQENYNAKKNVLFIVVDDLKPLLGSYGYNEIISPNIDRLANEGVLFSKAYAQQAICTASRMSFITGRRPDYTKIWDLSTKLRETRPDIITIPQHFKNNGYETIGMGKVMHGAKNNDPKSWTMPFISNENFDYADGYKMPANLYQSPEIHKKWDSLQAALDADPNADRGWFAVNSFMKSAGLRPLTENLDVPDNAYADGASSLKTIELLNRFNTNKKKFFLTVGFQKPHLPFTPPKKYWDLYDRDKISLAKFQNKSKGSPDDAYHQSGELRNYHDTEPSMDENGIVNEDKQRELIHGYMASVSFIDAQVGLILNHLKSLGMDQNTVVVFFGDHGWHLGDHGLWNKHSNFEEATRTPLIFKSPDISGGFINNSPVELLDIFPTVCKLAGIPIPEDIEGISLVPILNKTSESLKNFAISQYPRRCNVMRSVIGRFPDDCTLMGYAVRNDRYRYVAWVSGNFEDRSNFNNDKIVMEELYDYEIDPLETWSFSLDPNYQEVKDQMIENLRKVVWGN
tara:strand:- start:494 stop:2080 length:1587 start_codon:yes stop_codon:yes gene_type:complete